MPQDPLLPGPLPGPDPLLPQGGYPGPLNGPAHLILPGRPGQPMVVFFGAKDLAEGRFNFLQLGTDLRASRFFVNNGANHWYQFGIPGFGNSFAETVDSLRRWQQALQAPEICLIGTSMGGYGAVQYGAALGARVLAFGTDATLAAPLTRSAQYYTGAASGLGAPSCTDLRPLIAQTGSGAAADGAAVTLILGERDWNDIHAAWLLQQAGQVRVISLIGIDHWVPSALSRQSRLAPLLRAFVRNTPLPAFVDAGQAVAVPGYAPALAAAHRAAHDNDWAKAAGLARKALAAYPQGEAAEMLLGWMLVKLDQPAEAAQMLASALASKPDDVEALQRLAAALRRCGAPLRARQLYTQALRLDPGHDPSHYGLGLILQQMGDLAGAQQAVSTALRIQPKNTGYRDRLTAITQAIATLAAKPGAAPQPD